MVVSRDLKIECLEAERLIYTQKTILIQRRRKCKSLEKLKGKREKSSLHRPTLIHHLIHCITHRIIHRLDLTQIFLRKIFLKYHLHSAIQLLTHQSITLRIQNINPVRTFRSNQTKEWDIILMDMDMDMGI